ncbi:dephospho-CoA kinase [Aestuariibius insulae]|uniref:dephospho-CoA kinase n=1 Tax=Aestuariibius insulae TaxID=2058287 RepID=UPI00345F14C6
MSVLLGLTGSIATGKTITARIFAEEGISVWDADEAVHRLYANGGNAVVPISEAFPDAIKDGSVDRQVLKTELEKDPSAFDRLNSIVHPLVRDDREAFIKNHDEPILLFDIPLLFETGAEAWLHKTILTTIDIDEQRRRVAARRTMTETQLELILSRQMPDREKRKKADYVIETWSKVHVRRRVKDILKEISTDA